MIGFTFLFVILVSINSFVHSDQQLKQKFEAENVIPEVVDSVPASPIEIKYGPTVEVKLGNELAPAQVKMAPSSVSWPADSNAMHTLIMIDPDAPSRQHHTLREILHWLVINIPGSDLSKGQTKLSYVGSGPPEGSGLHRYIFLVYKQTGQLSLTENDKDIQQKRYKFSVKDFSRKYNLGQPVAGNFYQAQFDEHVRQKTDRSLAVALKTNQVVPDVIDTAPAHSAQIKYPNGHLVLQGRELTPTQVKDIPSNVTWPTEPNTLYTLVFSDPDAPSRQNPIRREMLHWLVVNIPGTNIAKGETYTEYIGSGAPEGTGLHRYVFLVFKQAGQLSLNRTKASNQSREGRPNFRVRDFAKQNKLGNPVAGNFFQAQYDDYVPILRAQLSGQKAN